MTTPTERDAGLRRLRSTTRISVAATVIAGGVFAALAAGSTHAKKVVVVRTSARRTVAVTQAPAPPLVAVAAQSESAPAPTPTPPAAPPAATYQPPVVSSGGS